MAGCGWPNQGGGLLNIDTTPTKHEWAWACSCGNVARDPVEKRHNARKGLFDHWDDHCPNDDPTGVLLSMSDPRWRAAWAKARMLKTGGFTANSGLQEAEESCAPVVVER